jgi:hypothetical protein
MSSTCCVTVAPLKLTASEETIRSAIKFSSVLPVPGFSLDTPQIEAIEIDYLSRTLGWSDPRGLFGYSETSEYKDLYVYFDYGDKTSAVNELATKAFKMYGLGGAMVGRAEPTWGNIRGTVIIVRLEPDPTFSPNLVYNPNFTLDEIYRTLVFFRDAEVSAHKIAVKRDCARFNKSPTSGPHPGLGSGVFTTYIGPAGTRTAQQAQADLDTCAKCGNVILSAERVLL